MPPLLTPPKRQNAPACPHHAPQKRGWRGLWVWLLVLGAAGGWAGCGMEAPPNMELYEGATITVTNVHTIYSDSGIRRAVLEAPLQEEFLNGDRLFPKGFKITFHDRQGQPESILTAQRARFDKMTEIYTAEGDVVVDSERQGRQLRSEELKWSRFERRVYTDQFVRIRTPEETLMGEGLTASQDFSSYKILKPRGRIPTSKL